MSKMTQAEWEQANRDYSQYVEDNMLVRGEYQIGKAEIRYYAYKSISYPVHAYYNIKIGNSSYGYSTVFKKYSSLPELDNMIRETIMNTFNKEHAHKEYVK